MPALPRRLARLATCGLLAVVGTLAACSSSPGPHVTAPSSGQPSVPVAPTATPDPADLAAATVARLSDVDLVGQVLMPGLNLSDPAEVSAQLVQRHRLGAVILFPGDLDRTPAGASAAQVRALADELRAAARSIPAGADVDLLIGTDQEYGWVTRVRSGLLQLPSAMAFGAAGRPELTEAAWAGAGAELAAAGIDIDFAPTADVLGSPANYIIGSRSYGSDAVAVAEQVSAAVRGLQASGVAAAIKHFPGHGHTTVDSHKALPVLSQSRSTLAKSDLPPFRAGIDAGVWAVMAGHLDVRSIDPGVPATFSRKVLVDLLRRDMGFGGVVISDSLIMEPAMRWPAGEAAVRALLAGNDLLLMPPDLEAAKNGLLDALKSGELPRQRLVEAVTRVLTLKHRLAAFDRPALSTVQAPAHRDAALAAAIAAITVLRGPCSGALLSGGVRVTGSGGRSQQIAWLTEALRRHDAPVVATGGKVIHLVGYGDGSADLAPGAAATVSMDTPFILRSSTSELRIATYSSSQVAMEALAAVIAGKAKAAGRSPVAVTGLPRSACAG